MKPLALSILAVVLIVNGFALSSVNSRLNALESTQAKLVSGELPLIKIGNQQAPLGQVQYGIINTLVLLSSESAHFKAVLKK